MVTAESVCRDCAFMGLRNRDGNLVEATARWREMPPGVGVRNDGAEIMPLCLMGRRNFQADYDRLKDSDAAQTVNGFLSSSASDVQGVLILMLDEPQQCDDWDRHREGTAPKEHRAMLDRKWQIQQEDNQNWWNRAFAAVAILVSMITIGVGAYVSFKAAEIQRDGPPAISSRELIRGLIAGKIPPLLIPSDISKCSVTLVEQNLSRVDCDSEILRRIAGGAEGPSRRLFIVNTATGEVSPGNTSTRLLWDAAGGKP